MKCEFNVTRCKIKTPDLSSGYIRSDPHNQLLGSHGSLNFLVYHWLWVTRHDSLSKTILQGAVEGGQPRGLQRKCWIDNVKQLTSLPMPEVLMMASCKKDWKRISVESSLVYPL